MKNINSDIINVFNVERGALDNHNKTVASLDVWRVVYIGVAERVHIDMVRDINEFIQRHEERPR